MKILHVLAQLPQQTGSGVYYRNLIEGLNHDEVQHALIYANQSPFEDDLNHYPSYPVQFMSEECPFPIPGMSDTMPYPHTIYSQMSDHEVRTWQTAFQKRLQDAKEQFQPDIVITHHLWYLTSLVLDCFSNIPVVGVSHGTDIRQARRHPQLAARYVNDLNRLSLVFSLSHQDKEAIQETYQIDEAKIHITGNGYNPQIFYPPQKKISDGTIKILYAGKIAQAKGVFELAATFPALKSKYPQLELHIIGNGEEDKKGQLYQIAQADEASGFFLYPAVSQLELAEKMRQADLFVLPSYFEGLATIVLEALACGLRAVVTDLLPLKKLLGDTVNQSGIIEYVDLPRLYDQDKPIKEDLPIFIEDLTSHLDLQIQRILDHSTTDSMRQEITRHSWPELIDRQYRLLQGLLSQ